MLKDLLDWDRIMVQPRYAGGHTEVLDVLFKDAKVIATWHEQDWQGSVAYAYELADGRFVALTDSYGSCSGCDSWEDSSDEQARNMCVGLANDAHVFDSLSALIDFIAFNVPADKGAYFHDQPLVHLLEPLRGNVTTGPRTETPDHRLAL